MISMVIFPSFSILFLVHSNLPLFHPKSNPRKISVNVSSDSMLPNLWAVLCPHLLNSRQQSTWSTFLFWVLWTTGSLFSSFLIIFYFLFVVVQLLTCVWLWPHGMWYARLPCPLPSPQVCSNSCPLSRWCHPTISSLVIPFSSCLQTFPASGSLPIGRLFASSSQSIGASVSVLTMTIQGWFHSGLADLISCSPRDSQESSPTPQFKSINSSVLSFLYRPTLTSIHDHWKNHSLD